ncbi:MAG TPA: GNAT family protein [Mycobacteriales bacterium]|nr:GNAT family protein [Mycobacteriales bacterium]
MTELRPIRVEDLDVITRWKTDPDYGSEFQWLGFGSTRRFRERVANDDVIDDEGGALAVVDGDELLGDVSWHKQQTNALTESFCWNFGIVLRPEARGKGHGSRAQRLLADYLFLHTTVNRVEASTDIDNVAEQRSLEKADFTREGVLRGWQWRQGAWRDMVLFSKLRGE